MSMAWEPDRRSDFFFGPPSHLCAVTYMTEISLMVTLNNQFTHSFKIPYRPKNSKYVESIFQARWNNFSHNKLHDIKDKFSTSLQIYAPMRAWGVKSRMCPPYPQRDRKRRLNGAVCRNHRIKRVVPRRC